MGFRVVVIFIVSFMDDVAYVRDVEFCMYSVWVCVCVDVLVICVFVFIVFLYCLVYVYLFFLCFRLIL